MKVQKFLLKPQLVKPHIKPVISLFSAAMFVHSFRNIQHTFELPTWLLTQTLLVDQINTFIFTG